jgi:integrase/recombinase XerD
VSDELAPIPPLSLEAAEVGLAKQGAAAYLASLAQGSRRSMRGALELVARELGTIVELVPWHRMRAAHVGALRSRFAARFAPATTNKILAALRGVARECSRLGLLEANELASLLGVRGVRGSRERRGRALAPHELRSLFASCGRDASPIGARDAALLALLYGCGLRRQEAAGLDVGDHRIEDGSILVRGKGNKERRLYLPSGAVDAVDRWRAQRGAEPGPLFFPVRKGGRARRSRMTEHGIALAIQSRARRAGVRRLSPHDLRRTLIGDLLDAGVDLAAVQAIAGHAQITTTAEYDRRGERIKQSAAHLVIVPFVAPGRPVDASIESEPPTPASTS